MGATNLKYYFALCVVLISCSQKIESGLAPSAITSAEQNRPPPASNEGTPSPEKVPAVISKAVSLVELPDKQVFDFFAAKCTGCHAKSGMAASFWSLPNEGFTLAALETNPDVPRIYAALYRRVHAVASPQPQAMPPSADAETLAKIEEVLRWFQVKLPIGVADAGARYAGLQDTSAIATLNFQCENPMTAREFVNKFFLAAFDTPPTVTNLAELSESLKAPSLDVPITKPMREKIVALLDDKQHFGPVFREKGIPKLAKAISGSTRIKDDLPELLKSALQGEFEALLRSKWESWEYDRYFTSEIVMVNKDSASVYGCAAPNPAENPYTECQMKLPRKGYFTTAGYLSSRSSSFLISNNNYGRMAGIYFSLLGEALKAATDGPQGAGAIPPLPNCLEANDLRAFSTAPRGSAAIPKFGTLCQSCHIGRSLASGSVLFRPFGPTGQLLDPATLATDASTKDLVKDATAKEWTTETSNSTPVDLALLQSLLTQSLTGPKACAVSSSDPTKVTELKLVSDLVAELMKNGDALSGGLARHTHRAFGVRGNVTLDLILDFRTDWKAGRRTLDKLMKTYFLAESFSCKLKQP